MSAFKRYLPANVDLLASILANVHVANLNVSTRRKADADSINAIGERPTMLMTPIEQLNFCCLLVLSLSCVASQVLLEHTFHAIIVL